MVLSPSRRRSAVRPVLSLHRGRALQEFEPRGRRFIPGTWVFPDFYGANHDAHIREEPDPFKPAVQLLTRAMRREAPEQDLSIDLAPIPVTPKSRFVIRTAKGVP